MTDDFMLTSKLQCPAESEEKVRQMIADGEFPGVTQDDLQVIHQEPRD